MPGWIWIVIAAMVILAVVVLVAALAVGRRKRTERLKARFGPEYERTVSETGERTTAEKTLVERERRRDKLDIVALPPAAQREYDERWRSVQTAFVDDPSNALGEADRLITSVMRERGYPVDDFDQRADDVSVDHPDIVANYRAAHDIQRSPRSGDVGTEDQRQAFVHYRALFEKLLDPQPQTTTSQETST